MNEKYTYSSLDYISDYKVYCFKRSFSDINPLARNPYKYFEGDYVPSNSNNYIYGANVLVVDFKNHVVHIIEDFIYKKTVKILAETDTSIFKHFKKRRYTSIDIYGNILNVLNIFDLYKCINSYPQLEIYLEEKKNYKKNELLDKTIKDSYLSVINNINQYKSNKLILSGYVLNCDKNKLKEGYSFEVSDKIHQEVMKPLIEVFEDEFYDKHNINSVANELLELFDLLYSLESSNNGKIIKYISNGKYKVTHIDKVRREIKSIIDINCECDLDDIMDLIFLHVYDEEYAEYLIGTLSNILYIND